jgi:hypothetical protein
MILLLSASQDYGVCHHAWLFKNLIFKF